MTQAAAIPGITFTALRKGQDPSPLRSDVAGFVLSTRRGPVGRIVRVEGWQEYLRIFGPPRADLPGTYAVRGYFENDGETAYIHRLGGRGGGPARALLDTSTQVTMPDGSPALSVPRGLGRCTGFQVEAVEPGEWANGAGVSLRLRPLSSGTVADVEVRVRDDATERIRAHDLSRIAETVNAASRYIRMAAVEAPMGTRFEPEPPQSLFAQERLLGGTDPVPDATDYLNALGPAGATEADVVDESRFMADEPEIAIMIVPDLARHTGDRWLEVATHLARQATKLADRLVVLDPPCSSLEMGGSGDWESRLDRLRTDLNERECRAVAVYWPPIRIGDLTDGTPPGPCILPASGHVAGVISRLDRLRGAHHTPANAPIFDAVAVEPHAAPTNDTGALLGQGINLLKSITGRGVTVWGGRVLAKAWGDGRLDAPVFLAHRRLAHRLVRAMRRCAEPLAFDKNTPELWMTLARTVTAVLTQAWRSGALLGATSAEAFRVQCNAATNPPDAVDQGRCVCTVEFAPAAPMEFIRLVVMLSTTGELEVFES